MIFEHKNILIVSPEPWDHIFVSKHHYAVHLANRGNVVFFLNPPGREYRRTSTPFENVFQIDYRGFPPLLRFYPAFLQRLVMSYVYRKIERLCGNQFDVIWSFDNSVFFNFTFLSSNVLKISHIVDVNQDFQTAKAAATADFCFCNTELIKERLSRYNRNTSKINHGYAPQPLRASREGVKRSRITAIYAGNLAIPYIDWNVFAEVVSNHPDVDFVFIGPDVKGRRSDELTQSAKNKVADSSNVLFAGRVLFEDLQAYYSSADVLMIAYMEKYHDNQVANTHKMIEYLGSGKAVVATYTSEYLNFEPLIVMSKNNSEWPGKFQSVISDLEFFNSEGLQRKRREFALCNTYDEQIKKIEQIISTNETR